LIEKIEDNGKRRIEKKKRARRRILEAK